MNSILNLTTSLTSHWENRKKKLIFNNLLNEKYVLYISTAMKHYIIILFFIPFALIANSYSLQRVKFKIEEHKEIYEIYQLGISIEELIDGWVVARVNEEEIKMLRTLGYTLFKYVEPPIRSDGYHSYEDMISKLDTITNQYPGITKKFSLGQSVEGRELTCLKISDNPEIDEAEPEIRFIGIIHGDEPIGCELLLNLADTLTSSYNNNGYLTDLVDNMEIFIFPMLNPDGREIGSRYNANGEDLNRDFPVPDSSIGGDYNWVYEPETSALINWSDTMNFTLSATFHSGARVVNYQWDYTNEIPPFHSLIREISKGYAIRNDSMFNSPDPWYADSGVIRGSEWYIVAGSLQDWSYHNTGCIDLTIELNPEKWPDSTKLPDLWQQNRNSILYLIHKAGTGVSGIVRDGVTGEPIYANIMVSGYNKGIKTDPDVGDYHRLLQTGIYDLTFTSEDYCTLTVYNFDVHGNSLQTLNVELTPAGTTSTKEPEILYISTPTIIIPQSFSITLSIPESDFYTLSIFDKVGRKIRNIFKDRLYQVGFHDESISIKSIPKGIYFLHLDSVNIDGITRKILIF